MQAVRRLKHAVNDFVGRRGWEIQKKQPHLIDFLRSRRITTVIDVGANEGQYATGLRVRGYHGEIIPFEPDRAAFKALKANAATDPLWTVNNEALGDENSVRAFNVTSYSEFNSFLPPTGSLTSIDPRSAVESQEQVAVASLDMLFSNFDGKRVFLKSDTQGYEKHVLLGAVKSLPKLFGVQVEISLLEMYEGQPSLVEIVELMKSFGYSLAMIWPNHFHPDDPVSLIEVDCVFANDRLH